MDGESSGAVHGLPSGAALPTLLLLTDGRFPAGGHAHSGGLEPVAGNGGLHDLADLERFLRGRLSTAGMVGAAFAASACSTWTAASAFPDVDGALDVLGRELDARMPSPVQRAASRQLGRQLLRAGRAVWPHPVLDRLAAARWEPHQALAFGVVAGAAGFGPDVAALVAAHDCVTGPATAAVRLLGLDPFEVHALLARLAEPIAAVADTAARYATVEPTDLPAHCAPLLDVSAEHHATWEVRLFAS